MYGEVDIARALEKLIRDNYEVIFISGNIGNLGRHKFNSKKELMDTFLKYILLFSGEETTLLTSTFTLHLANTDIPFDPDKTPSMHGVIANYFLNCENRIRSFHPFTSFASIGPKAEYICKNNTRFSYGIDSPYDKMLRFDKVLTISVGLPPNLTCSIIHHAEFIMHVPYRFIKEFFHPVVREGEVRYENFYMHVIYRSIYDEIDRKRDKNRKFFKHFVSEYGGKVIETELGNGKVYAYNTKLFFQSAIDLLKKDIYSWLSEEPENRPYRVL